MIIFIFCLVLLITFFLVCVQPLFLKKNQVFISVTKKTLSKKEYLENRMNELKKDLLEQKISEQDFQYIANKFKKKNGIF